MQIEQINEDKKDNRITKNGKKNPNTSSDIQKCLIAIKKLVNM